VVLISSYSLYILILSFSARPSQDREVIELQEFAVSRGFDGAIQLWDLPYWKRKQCASLFGYGTCIHSSGLIH
jgi:Zn-dependent oligopeptidase